jgi:hypothetical protein
MDEANMTQRVLHALRIGASNVYDVEAVVYEDGGPSLSTSQISSALAHLMEQGRVKRVGLVRFPHAVSPVNEYVIQE